MAFLDNQLASHGARCVVYVSSNTRKQNLGAVLTILVRRRYPSDHSSGRQTQRSSTLS